MFHNFDTMDRIVGDYALATDQEEKIRDMLEWPNVGDGTAKRPKLQSHPICKEYGSSTDSKAGVVASVVLQETIQTIFLLTDSYRFGMHLAKVVLGTLSVLHDVNSDCSTEMEMYFPMVTSSQRIEKSGAWRTVEFVSSSAQSRHLRYG